MVEHEFGCNYIAIFLLNPLYYRAEYQKGSIQLDNAQ